MGNVDSVQRIRQELQLLSEYLSAAPKVEWPFLMLHAELLLEFVRDGALEANTLSEMAA